MKGLRLSPDLTLPLETVTQSVAILAKRRAGKSYLARGFAEQLLGAGQQVVIIDPKGDWWGIRSSSDGKSPGFPVVVLGGEHGDLPLEKNAAETVARLIVEERVNVLLDLSAFRKSEIAFFLGGLKQQDGLLELIYRLKAKEQFRTPVMLIVDEADAIAPQKPFPGEERMLGAMSDIVRRGGQRGLGSMLISQRSAVVNKDVLTQTQVMIALRTIAKHDMNAIMDWVDVHGVPEQAKILKESLPALPTGDAWVLSTGWPTEEGIFQRIHASAIRTFDSGATPKPGEKRISPKNLADVDMAALERRMAETIERAKADDPRELRKQIAELKRVNSLRPSPAPVKADPAAAAAALAKAAQDASRQTARAFQKLLESSRRAILKATAALQKLATELEAAAPPEKVEIGGLVIETLVETGPLAPRPVRLPAPVPYDPVPASFARPPKNGSGEESPRVGGASQRVLDALAELLALGVREAPRVQVAFMAGYTNLNSKGFANAIGALRSAGYIDYPGSGTVELTDAGSAQASTAQAPRSSKELQDRLIQMLGGANGRIVRELVSAYPGALPREDLAARAGYTNVNSKGFANAIGRLRTLGFIDYPSQGRVAAMPVLFLE